MILNCSGSNSKENRFCVCVSQEDKNSRGQFLVSRLLIAAVSGPEQSRGDTLN